MLSSSQLPRVISQKNPCPRILNSQLFSGAFEIKTETKAQVSRDTQHSAERKFHL